MEKPISLFIALVIFCTCRCAFGAENSSFAPVAALSVQKITVNVVSYYLATAFLAASAN